MMKACTLAGIVSALWLGAAPNLIAHGGRYPGPTDTVPPNLGGGGDKTPPGNPGGSGTPGPGAPTTPGSKGPTTGGVPGAPTAGAGAGLHPVTGLGGNPNRNGEGFERWEFWWELNKEPFLNLKARLRDGDVITGSAGFNVGRSKPANAIATSRVSPSEVRELLAPALIDALQESNADVVDSAAIALGRTLRSEDAAPALAALTRTLGHPEKSAREAAALALGILGSADAVETLRSLLNDTPEGRRLTRHPQGVEDLVRSFAAASLGLIHDPRTIADLEQAVSDPNLQSKPDVRSTALLALGMMQENHTEIVSFLLGVMEDRSLSSVVRAQAPIALGRLNQQSGAGSIEARQVMGPKLLPLFEDDKTDRDLRRSLAITIGALASVEDAAAIDALVECVARESDDQTRHFAIMALAEIGARDGEPALHAAAHRKLQEFFLRELLQPKRITHRPFGALALAVHARNPRLDVGLRTSAMNKLEEAFGATNNPSHQGAIAIGLGLLADKAAAEELWTRFEDSNDPALKGYVAVALGLMRANGHAAALRGLTAKQGLDAKFRLQIARSLGLMGDAQAVPFLVDYMLNAQSIGESSSAAQAIGLIGDRSAIAPLLSVLRNPGKQPLQRGFAAVAIGLLGEKSELPWNAVFLVGANYRAKTAALAEIFDIL